jgi:hypothetical protein
VYGAWAPSSKDLRLKVLAATYRGRPRRERWSGSSASPWPPANAGSEKEGGQRPLAGVLDGSQEAHPRHRRGAAYSGGAPRRQRRGGARRPLLAQDGDRFAREPAQNYLLRRKFEAYGTTLRALNDRGDDSSEGQLTDGVLDQLARFDGAKTPRRTRRAELRKA